MYQTIYVLGGLIQHENRRFRKVLAQLHAFVDRRNAEHRHTHVQRPLCDGEHAMPIGIGFDDCDDAAIVAQQGSHVTQVVLVRVEIDSQCGIGAQDSPPRFSVAQLVRAN